MAGGEAKGWRHGNCGVSLLRPIAPLPPPAPNLPLMPHLHLAETHRPLNWTNTVGRDCDAPPRVAAMMIGQWVLFGHVIEDEDQSLWLGKIMPNPAWGGQGT